jgi:glycosyltransferase involved in cell wall biosynthesis
VSIVTSAEVHSHPRLHGHTAERSGRVPVAFVIDNMGLGGTELNAVRTAERLDRARFDLRVVCIGADGPLSDRYRAMGVPVVRIELRSMYGPTMLSAGLRFVRYLRDEHIQIVHAHDMYSNVFATVWARVAGTPVVIASRRWWHSLPNRKLRLGNAAAFRMAGAVLANSPQVARSVLETTHLPPGRVWTVTNFADDDAFLPVTPEARLRQRRAWEISDDALVVGCVARLVPVKDHATLVDAFAQVRAEHPNVHLVLIGDGECRSRLEGQVARLGLSGAVTFTGELRGGGNHHRAFDISALTSLSEGFPNSLVEAMAAGIPVVATAAGGNVDAVADGVTGFLVPPGNAGDLALALRRLVESTTLREAFGTAGRDRARSMYRAAPALLALQSMYDTLLERAAA